MTVTNTSPAGSLDPIRITSLVDDVYGNLNGVGTCNTAGNAYPTALISGASYTCSFTKFVAGDGKTKTSVTDVISATVVDDDGGAPYTKDSNPITVSIKPVGSSISVQKEVSYNGGAWLKSLTIDEAPSPGVTVNYRVVITNNSTVDLVTINSLKDKVKLNGGGFGASYDLVSDCVLPFDLASNGGSKTCSFSLKLSPSIVNPIAMILSAAMLLDHVGAADKAERVRNAVAVVVKEGKARTYDMMRLPGGPDVFAKGAATTRQMTDAIIARL